MATALNIKRKNIDLPVDTLQKLSLLAVAHGKSLKAYIESILIAKADSTLLEATDSPSPSGDPWFDDQQNLSVVKEGITEYESGQKRTYTLEEIKKMLQQ